MHAAQLVPSNQCTELFLCGRRDLHIHRVKSSSFYMYVQKIFDIACVCVGENSQCMYISTFLSKARNGFL